MDLVDQRVLHQMSSDVGVAIGEADEAGGDQRGEGVLDIRSDVLVDRTELDQGHPPGDEELVHQVERGDAGHVPGAEDGSDAG